MFKIVLVKNDASKTYNITPIINNFSWDSNLSLTSVIDFIVTEGTTKYMPINPIDIGDLVIIFEDDEEINRGIVVEEKSDGSTLKSYVSYDYAWYLGKSKSVYQFNGSTAKVAITKILNDFGMPIGNIVEMSTLINTIYIQKSPADIIQDIIDQHEKATGVKLFAELIKGKLYIKKVSDEVVIGKFKLVDSFGNYDVLTNPLGANKTRSIENMRNRVKIILSENDNYDTIALEQNSPGVSKYGLLEETFKIDAEDSAKARVVAKILLERLNKIFEDNSISLMGDSSFKAGRLFDVIETTTKMEGRYMITECKHQVSSGGVHTMDLTLALPEDVS